MKESSMTPENFVYWLQGLFELTPDLDKLNKNQIQMIRDHLGYVFTHIEDLKKIQNTKPIDWSGLTGLSPKTVQIC